MDVLGSMGIEGLHAVAWVAAIVACLGVAAIQIWLPIMENWRTSWRHVAVVALRSLLAGAVLYVIASLTVVVYIMAHATDPRWSVGRDARIDAPQLSAGIPLFDGIVNALNGFAGTVENGVNDALAIKNAFLVSGEFMLNLLWGLLVTVVIGAMTWIMSRYLAWWRARRVDELMVSNRELKANLDDVRRQLNLPAYIPKKPN